MPDVGVRRGCEQQLSELPRAARKHIQARTVRQLVNLSGFVDVKEVLPDDSLKILRAELA